MADNSSVKYLNKDFESLREGLINFSKVYFPNTYQDFNASNPGMMFIEMASYVGDVLSYYLDNQIQELFLLKTEQKENILNIAQAFGYKPKVTTVSSTNLDVFMVVPSIHEVESNSNYSPDYRYAIDINAGLEIASKNDPNIVFRTYQPIIFNNFDNSVEVKVFDYDGSGNPQHYLLKKTVPAYSSTATSETISVPTTPEKYYKFILSRDDIVEITSITDSEQNRWYEVPYLAQDTVFIDTFNSGSSDVPYLLKLKKVPRRFITRITPDNKTEVQFGAGISSNPDEVIVPNPNAVGGITSDSIPGIDTPLDPSNFLYTKAYGQCPYGTTLTVNYNYGGGMKSNVSKGSLTQLRNITYSYDDTLNASLVSNVKNSVAATNNISATGGMGAETVDEIRNNALAYFATQQRAVTKEDYITRTYSMPSRYGAIAKAYITKDTQITSEGREIPNPLALNLYTLGYTSTKKLTTLGNEVKINLKNYIDRYRMLTDSINILDGYIINIGVRFSIITFDSYNKNEVILKCMKKITDYFNIDKWQINQPIVLSEVRNELMLVDGVRNVNDIEIFNRFLESDGYSGNVYDIKAATKDGIVYPSLDPSCFELKYPTRDIIGRAK